MAIFKALVKVSKIIVAAGVLLIFILFIFLKFAGVIPVYTWFEFDGGSSSFAVGKKSITSTGVLEGVPNEQGTDEASLQDGDVAVATRETVQIFRQPGQLALRYKGRSYVIDLNEGAVYKGVPR